jgi:hypothetical protein
MPDITGSLQPDCLAIELSVAVLREIVRVRLIFRFCPKDASPALSVVGQLDGITWDIKELLQ